MKKLFLLVAILAATSTVAQAGILNGAFGLGDESFWTQWRAPWGSTESWAVTNTGPTGPEGTLSLTGSGSFGWYQVYECPMGWSATLNGQWTGNLGGAGWAELMLFSVAPGTDAATIVNRIDTGAAGDIAFKKDSWGLNPPASWDWQTAGLSPLPAGNGGMITSQGWVVVGVKLGSGGGAASLSVDNLTACCVPEPASILALSMGLGGLLIRRKR